MLKAKYLKFVWLGLFRVKTRQEILKCLYNVGIQVDFPFSYLEDPLALSGAAVQALWLICPPVSKRRHTAQSVRARTKLQKKVYVTNL